MKRKSSLFGCLNKKGRHAELDSASHLISVLESGEIPYQVRNDKCIFDGNHAFTLIELLVVVLIIGILAAVAVPQYQKAVEKSKAAQAITLLKSVYQAADSYYLANGSWPIDFDELSLDSPWTEHVEAWAGLPARSDGDWSLQLRSGNYPGVLVTRLRGKYKGGMFLMYAKFGTVEDKTRTILCGELKIGDFKFEGDPGGFCQKLFGGTSKGGGNDTRLYSFK